LDIKKRKGFQDRLSKQERQEMKRLLSSGLQPPAAAVAGATGMTPEQVARVFAGIDAKRNVTRYLRSEPLHPTAEVSSAA
jgi:hypothetical protein